MVDLKNKQTKTFQKTAKKALQSAAKLRSKSHLDMRDLLLQEKLLGTLGRWEEAVNNQKVFLNFQFQLLCFIIN